MTIPDTWLKSSFSGGADGNNCIELATTWQKSTFSGGGDGNACLELATTPTALHLRESDAPTTHLTTTPTALAALLHGIRSRTLTAGRVDHHG
ncbi:DUF397 domain-containing protein [Streptomyces sp. N50]|uniref:DUF397 domain-containing protein n=1 Tax=Streptomyces sp. N50 TaxID=3081765 RepID=UPI00296211E9|nr:DUF397 domain-containing protein [Streptomyces sp. N50]WOX10243.1 DUF397 domain-containing protein [Streptomyces sp. N50]